jgi:hypothetical protein
MGLEADSAFAVIQRSLEEFTAGIGKVMGEQAQTQETLEALEYELEQLRKQIAENALTTRAPAALPVVADRIAVAEARQQEREIEPLVSERAA